MQSQEVNNNSKKPPVKFISRKSSLNITTTSPQKVKKKQKFSMDKQQNENLSENTNTNKNSISNIRKEKVCQGQKLFRQATSQNSREKRDNFLTRYAKDPFMRKKMDLSIKKYSKGKPVVTQQSNFIMQKKYTTFRQEQEKQTLKTYELISNCKSLMEELKKNKRPKNPQIYSAIRKNKFYQRP